MREDTFRLALRTEVDAISLPAEQRWVPQRGPVSFVPRLRALPIAVAVVLVLAVSAYAVPLLLPDVFERNDPTAVEVLQSGRATELQITRETSGVSITLDRAYADTNRVIVQFTIPDVPADPGQSVPSPLTTGGTLTLTDADGHVLKVVRGQESPFIRDARWTGQPLIGVYSFDASSLKVASNTVSLHLIIGELRGIGSDRNSSVTRVRGPWRFDFEVRISR